MTKQTITNKSWVFAQIMVCILIAAGIAAHEDMDKVEFVSFILTGAVLFTVYAILYPNRVRYDEHGITVHYLFGLKTCAGWKELSSVDTAVRFALIPWQKCYVISGFESKLYFHREACIPKNKKTTRMLEEYYPRGIG